MLEGEVKSEGEREAEEGGGRHRKQRMGSGEEWWRVTEETCCLSLGGIRLSRPLSSPRHSVSSLGWAVQEEAVDLGVLLDARCLPDPGQVSIPEA